MQLGGKHLLQADAETLWTALHDAALLERCVPGCDRVTWTGKDTLTAEIVLRAGTATRRYTGRVRIADARPHECYRLLFGESGHGTSVAALITLTPRDGATLFRYEVEARLDGHLARLGAPVAAAIANRVARRFFRRLDRALTDYPAVQES